jgi:hypothetical protein
VVNSCLDGLIVDEASTYKGTTCCWFSSSVSVAGLPGNSLGIMLLLRIIKRILENAPSKVNIENYVRCWLVI